MSHKARKFAGLIASIAVGISLLGAGTYASFQANANATDTVKVGSFAIHVASSTPGAVVVNSGATHTVTLDTSSSPILSSGASQQALDFQVINDGAIPAKISVSSGDGLTGHFSDLLPNPIADVTLDPAGGTTPAHDYTGGIKWSALDNTDLGQSHSVTYTITATG
jgi:predicted ribosomally synthesized peptide with SipW-like signal peptide